MEFKITKIEKTFDIARTFNVTAVEVNSNNEIGITISKAKLGDPKSVYMLLEREYNVRFKSVKVGDILNKENTTKTIKVGSVDMTPEEVAEYENELFVEQTGINTGI